MSPDTILTSAAVVIAALLGLIGVLLGMIHRNAKTAARQTQNSHTINLRDDLDEKFEGLADLVKGVALDQGGMKADIRLIRTDQTADRASAGHTAELATEAIRLAQQALERTRPKHQTPTQGEPQ